MNKKTYSLIMLTLLLISMLTLALSIQPAKASGTIYIRADGSIDPPTANITSPDNITYIFTDNIYDSIVVKRDNIVVDGAGFTVQGTEADGSMGVDLSGRSNVTVKGMTVKAFDYGIHVFESLNIGISGNKITANKGYGIMVGWSSSNNIVENIISSNNDGILIGWSSGNTVYGNYISANRWYGVWLSPSSGDIIYGNSIIGNDCGIGLDISSNNIIYHNNFVNNVRQVHDASWDHPEIFDPSINIWDDGYPSGGNHWSDYEERYPDATEIDGSVIWDTPYVIDENNQDNYPLMEPWIPAPSIPATIDELKTEIEELGSKGEIDNQGIVKSLIAKLNVAQRLIDDGKIDQAKNILNAFINEVQAQSGKHITPEAADLLIKSAEYILSNP